MEEDEIYYQFKKPQEEINEWVGYFPEKLNLIKGYTEFKDPYCTFDKGLAEYARCYKGIHCAQVPGTFDVFKFLFKKNNFNKIIELGTYMGGFTHWLHDHKPNNCLLMTYDFNSENYSIDKSININFNKVDVLSEAGKKIISNILNLPGQNLILCDGGDKNKEFNIYSKYLKKNDVIMIHDYNHKGNNFQDYADAKLWPWDADSKYEKIKISLKKYNLKEYYNNLTLPVLWGCFKK